MRNPDGSTYDVIIRILELMDSGVSHVRCIFNALFLEGWCQTAYGYEGFCERVRVLGFVIDQGMVSLPE